jgi:PTH2 family peptidyl-tRNA hydrolase
MYKQVILVRKDLNLSKGKMGAQIGHGCVEAVLKSDKKLVSNWRNLGQKKIVLKVENEKELYKFKEEAKDFGITTALIKDAGMTELKPGTITCLAIGPDTEERIDNITKDLKML